MTPTPAVADPAALSSAIDSFAPSAPISHQGAQEATNLAQAILDARLGIEALRLFDRLIAKAPIKPVFALLFVAVFNLRLQDLRQAGLARDDAEGKVAVTFPSDDGAAWLAMGRHLTRLGEFAGALEALRKAAELRPRCHATACFLGQLLVLHKRYDEADEVFSRAEKICAMFAGATRFSDSFWRSIALLDDRQPAAVEWVAKPNARPRAVLLLSCNAGYFHRYAAALVSSWRRLRALKATASDDASWLIHFHLVLPDASVLERIERWSREGLMVAATAESPALPPDEILDAPRFCHAATYFAVARLRVAPWLLANYRVPIVVSDVDMTLIGEPDQILLGTAQADVGVLRHSPRKKPLWEEFAAALLVLRPTPEASRFAILLASYVEHFLRSRKFVWTLDQAALYSTVEYMRRHHPGASLRDLPPDFFFAPGWDAQTPGAQAVLANAAASMSYRSSEELRAALEAMPASEMHTLTSLTRKRTQHLRQFWLKQYGNRVIAGPFAGMVYDSQSADDSYLPKVLGSYDQELHALIRILSGRAYRRVVNIGCGGGYYAVGLARLLRRPVLAIEVDAQARATCARLAEANGVAELVAISSQRVTAADMRHIGRPDTLFVIDADHGERELLTPEALAVLGACDLLVKVHDSADPDLPFALRDTFDATHQTELFERRGLHAEWPEAWASLSGIDRLLSLWEFQTDHPAWLWAQGRNRTVPVPQAGTVASPG